jgi:predicted transcriptional regulator of viral defense system
MKPEQHPNARDFVGSLAARGRYQFSSKEAQAALAVSAAASKLALNRLANQNLIASPARGFYVVIPPEYRSLRCLPADQFIPALMQHFNLSYYAGLLSAAQYYGAAHHRPQEFQVFVARGRRPIHCGDVRVVFMVRKHLGEIPVQNFNTPRGTIQVSTPEATAFDLIGYTHRTGGLNNVATVLSELAEKIDPQKLGVVANTAPVPWAQRLGYLLEHLGYSIKASMLKQYVHQHATEYVLLLPKAMQKHAQRSKTWKLCINADVRAES